MKIKPPADVTDFQRDELWGPIQNPDALFTCAKAKRQQQMFSVAKAKRQLQLRQGEIDFWR